MGEYPWTGNWLYTSQRWTGLIAFIYIVYHVVDLRFTGVHLMGGGYNYAFSKVWWDFQRPVGRSVLRGGHRSGVMALLVWCYGCLPRSGDWTVGENARRKFGYVCTQRWRYC